MSDLNLVPVVANINVQPGSPGWKTSEFYLALAAKLLGGLIASGWLTGHNTALQMAGIVMALLAQLGYTYSRTTLKAAAMPTARETTATFANASGKPAA